MVRRAVAALVAVSVLWSGGCASEGSRYHEADPLLLAIGSPDPAAVPMREVVGVGAGTYRYRHHVGRDRSFAWLAAVGTRMGDPDVAWLPPVTPKLSTDGIWSATAWCHVLFDDAVWSLYVTVEADQAGEYTTVEVRQR